MAGVSINGLQWSGSWTRFAIAVIHDTRLIAHIKDRR